MQHYMSCSSPVTDSIQLYRPDINLYKGEEVEIILPFISEERVGEKNSAMYRKSSALEGKLTPSIILLQNRSVGDTKKPLNPCLFRVFFFLRFVSVISSAQSALRRGGSLWNAIRAKNTSSSFTAYFPVIPSHFQRN